MITTAQGGKKIGSRGGNMLIGTQISSIGLERMNHLTTSRTKHGGIAHRDMLKTGQGFPTEKAADAHRIPAQKKNIGRGLLTLP